MPRRRDNRKINIRKKPRIKNVLGISGSPRTGGAGDLLLESALEGARSAGCATEKIRLNRIDFKACRGCDDCTATGICTLEDGMQPLYRKLESADIVIVGSPVFFGSISAQLKMMIDRTQCLWARKYILGHVRPGPKRKGIFLCTAGRDDKRPFRNAKEIIKIFFRVLDIKYAGGFLLSGLNSPSARSSRFKAALKEAFKMGFNLGRGT